MPVPYEAEQHAQDDSAAGSRQCDLVIDLEFACTVQFRRFVERNGITGKERIENQDKDDIE